MRRSEINRKTNETSVKIDLTLEGDGGADISTGSGFFDHMMTLFAVHGKFDLFIRCEGDTEVDFHHSIEDIGICLGSAFREALGDMRGIIRYADAVIPMDEALVLCAADISGRSYLDFDIGKLTEKAGNFDTELVMEFFAAFTRSAGITLHIKTISGLNTHHIIEACFKAFARVMRKAVSEDPDFSESIPSSKGIL